MFGPGEQFQYLWVRPLYFSALQLHFLAEFLAEKFHLGEHHLNHACRQYFSKQSEIDLDTSSRVWFWLHLPVHSLCLPSFLQLPPPLSPPSLSLHRHAPSNLLFLLLHLPCSVLSSLTFLPLLSFTWRSSGWSTDRSLNSWLDNILILYQLYQVLVPTLDKKLNTVVMRWHEDFQTLKYVHIRWHVLYSVNEQLLLHHVHSYII